MNLYIILQMVLDGILISVPHNNNIILLGFELGPSLYSWVPLCLGYDLTHLPPYPTVVSFGEALTIAVLAGNRNELASRKQYATSRGKQAQL